MSNKVNWLDEVKADARFNYLRRLREQEEKKKYEDSKREGVIPKLEVPVASPEPEDKKGK